MKADYSDLTTRQREIFEYIRERIEAGAPPTIREIGKRFGISSPNGVKCHLTALRQKDYITVEEGGVSRGIRFTDRVAARGIPLLATGTLIRAAKDGSWWEDSL